MLALIPLHLEKRVFASVLLIPFFVYFASCVSVLFFVLDSARGVCECVRAMEH